VVVGQHIYIELMGFVVVALSFLSFYSVVVSKMKKEMKNFT